VHNFDPGATPRELVPGATPGTQSTNSIRELLPESSCRELLPALNCRTSIRELLPESWCRELLPAHKCRISIRELLPESSCRELLPAQVHNFDPGATPRELVPGATPGTPPQTNKKVKDTAFCDTNTAAGKIIIYYTRPSRNFCTISQRFMRCHPRPGAASKPHPYLG